MSTELAKFDMSTVAEQLRERIKLAFVEAIPDEQWDALIKAEWKKFTRDDQDRYGHRRSPSPLSQLCHEALTALAKEKIAAALSGPEWEAEWKGISRRVEELIIERRTELIDAVLVRLVGSAAQQIIEDLKQSTESRGY